MRPLERRITVATTQAQEELFSTLAIETMNQFPGLDITVCALVKTPACAPEIIDSLCFEDLGEELLLLGLTIEPNGSAEELEEALEVRVNIIGGASTVAPAELLEALTARESWYL